MVLDVSLSGTSPVMTAGVRSVDERALPRRASASHVLFVKSRSIDFHYSTNGTANTERSVEEV